MGFIEPFPHLVSANPGGAEDPLGESVLDPEQPWLRVFEPRDTRLVIGRHQDPRRELLLEAARSEGIPIHRRVAGGGAVVLAPGSVVVALRMAKTVPGTDCYFAAVNRALGAAVQACAGIAPLCRGHGDLVLAAADGAERKILGASQRQNSRWVIYLGVFLVDDLIPLMERLLPHPSREPGYRAGRGHGEFCTHLGRYGVTVPGLVEAVVASCRRELGARDAAA